MDQRTLKDKSNWVIYNRHNLEGQSLHIRLDIISFKTVSLVSLWKETYIKRLVHKSLQKEKRTEFPLSNDQVDIDVSEDSLEIPALENQADEISQSYAKTYSSAEDCSKWISGDLKDFVGLFKKYLLNLHPIQFDSDVANVYCSCIIGIVSTLSTDAADGFNAVWLIRLLDLGNCDGDVYSHGKWFLLDNFFPCLYIEALHSLSDLLVFITVKSLDLAVVALKCCLTYKEYIFMRFLKTFLTKSYCTLIMIMGRNIQLCCEARQEMNDVSRNFIKSNPCFHEDVDRHNNVRSTKEFMLSFRCFLYSYFGGRLQGDLKECVLWHINEVVLKLIPTTMVDFEIKHLQRLPILFKSYGYIENIIKEYYLRNQVQFPTLLRFSLWRFLDFLVIQNINIKFNFNLKVMFRNISAKEAFRFTFNPVTRYPEYCFSTL